MTTTRNKSYQLRGRYSHANGFPSPLAWTDVDFFHGTATGEVSYQPYDGGDWRSNIRRKVTATTHMWGHEVSNKPGNMSFHVERSYVAPFGTPGVVVWVESFKGDWGTANLAIPADPSGLDADKANNLAAEKLVKNALKVQRQFQSGVFLGELAETIRLIRNPLSAIFENTLQYCDRLRKRGRIYKRLKDRRKLVTDLWLQYSFGVAPLMADIDNAAEAAAKIITYRLPSQVVRGSGRSTWSDSEQNLTQNFSLIRVRGKKQTTYDVSVRYTACVKVSNDTTKASLEGLGVTWGDFFPTVWEILPYSFLVDYFTNCGTVIDTLALNEANLGWVNRGEQKLVSNQITELRFLDPTVNNQFKTVITANEPGDYPSISRKSFDRNAYLGYPIPTLRFKLPFSSPIKDANLAALALANKEALLALR
jgi:hypothetical protein